MNLPSTTKIPLLWATRMLTSLCEVVDQSDTVDNTLTQMFQDAQVAHAEAIDRRKALMWSMEGALKAARGARAEIDQYIQKLKSLQEKLKLSTKSAMLENPDLPWKDSFGRKLSLVRNSQASLRFPFDLKESRTFSNLVDDDTIQMFEIPDKYLTKITVRCLDHNMIKKDIAAGIKLDWVEMEHGSHVRGLLPKDEEVGYANE